MQVAALDAHVAGGAVRLLTAGVPTLDGGTLAERRSSFEDRAGYIADALTREPRGHAGIVGVVLTEGERADADCGMLFFTGAGARRLSGHGAMAAAALAVDAGLLSPHRPGRVDVDTEGGPLVLTYEAAARGWPRRLSVTGPPASVVRGGLRVTTARRVVSVDIAWSGSELLAVVDGESAAAPLSARHTLELRRAAREILEAIESTARLTVPGTDAPAELGGCVFVGPPADDRADVRAVLVRPDGTVSRTASVTATSALAAVLAAMGAAQPGGITRYESLAGATWTAELGPAGAAIEVTVTADVYLTGTHSFVLEPSDPLLRGVVWW